MHYAAPKLVFVFEREDTMVVFGHHAAKCKAGSSEAWGWEAEKSECDHTLVWTYNRILTGLPEAHVECDVRVVGMHVKPEILP